MKNLLTAIATVAFLFVAMIGMSQNVEATVKMTVKGGKLVIEIGNGPEKLIENGKSECLGPDDNRLCKTVTTTAGSGHGIISAGTIVSVFVHGDGPDPSVGMGYIGVPLTEDFDTENDNCNVQFDRSIIAPTHDNYDDWELDALNFSY